MKHQIDTRGIEFQVVWGDGLRYVPNEVFDETQALDARALAASLPDLTDRQIAVATGGDNLHRYRRGRMDAGTEVGQRYGAGQIFADQIQVFAWRGGVGGTLVGETFGANNTSDPDREKKMDALLPLHKWDWHGMIAVDPNEQGRGLARVMSALILARRSLLQPVSVHVWNVPHVRGILEGGKLRPRGEAVTVTPFGKEGPSIDRQWYAGRVAVTQIAFFRQPGASTSFVRAMHSAIRNGSRFGTQST